MAVVLSGHFSTRLYVAYSIMYVVGTLLAMQIPFVGFNAVQSSEHMAAGAVLIFLQVYMGVKWVVGHLHSQMDNTAALVRRFFRMAIIGSVGFVAVASFLMVVTGYRIPWAGRFYTLLDPTYAKQHIPIIASVSEHQPTTWSSFFFDLHTMVFLFPVGPWIRQGAQCRDWQQRF